MLDTIDPIALAALRPGMPTASLAAALGLNWSDPDPGAGGKTPQWLTFMHGFSARLDVEGHIGLVRFGGGFPEETSVERVHLGSTLAAVAKVRPDLTFHEASAKYPERRFAAVQAADGVWLEVRFIDEVADRITLAQAAAVYPEIALPAYPQPNGVPGAPFADSALKLAVLSALLRDKLIDLGEPEQLAAHVLGREVDLEVYGEDYGTIPEVRDWLERYPLDDALLTQVRTLSLDGGNAVYPFIDSTWGGEDDQFDVKTLEGIEHLQNLKEFHVTALIDTVDLRQLAGLPVLQVVQVGVDVKHLDALLLMPALEVVGQMGDATYGEATSNGDARAVYEALKARGVRVRVHWTTHETPGEPPAYE